MQLNNLNYYIPTVKVLLFVESVSLEIVSFERARVTMNYSLVNNKKSCTRSRELASDLCTELTLCAELNLTFFRKLIKYSCIFVCNFYVSSLYFFVSLTIGI